MVPLGHADHHPGSRAQGALRNRRGRRPRSIDDSHTAGYIWEGDQVAGIAVFTNGRDVERKAVRVEWVSGEFHELRLSGIGICFLSHLGEILHTHLFRRLNRRVGPALRAPLVRPVLHYKVKPRSNEKTIFVYVAHFNAQVPNEHR